MEGKIRLVLADDHHLVLEALLLLLKGSAEFSIGGTAGNGVEAVRITKQIRPNVVLMDLAMPLLDGVGAAREVLSVLPKTRILILSAFVEPVHVWAALESGAAGFLFKGCTSTQLFHSIREVQGGGFCYPEGYSLSAACPNRARRAGAPGPRKGTVLTRRETEVLRRVAQGRANKESASELGVSVKTVEKHRQQVMDKLGIHQTAGLTRYAVAAGLL